VPRTPRKRAKRPAYRSTARSSRDVVATAKRIGETIRELRAERELTQEAAAESAELSAKHWQDLEAGRSNPTLSSLVAVARALHVSLSQLFERETHVLERVATAARASRPRRRGG
jgi:transcriptional regulator with XRE-family HTH domain